MGIQSARGIMGETHDLEVTRRRTGKQKLDHLLGRSSARPITSAVYKLGIALQLCTAPPCTVLLCILNYTVVPMDCLLHAILMLYDFNILQIAFCFAGQSMPG